MSRQLIYKVGALIATVLVLNLVWFDYVRRESTVYSWDYDGYWAKCWNFERELKARPVSFVLDTLRSIRSEEYTAEPTFPTALAIGMGEKLHLFSYSRASYILANGNLLIIPSLLLLAWLVSGLRNQTFSAALSSIPPAVWIATGIMALTPAFWLPLYRGYPDGGGLVFCFLITGLFLRWHQKPRSPRDEFLSWSAIVVLLVGLVFFRRWYLYWVLWFWVAAGAVLLSEAYAQWHRGLRGLSLLRKPLVLGMAGVAFGLLMAIVSPHFVRQLVSYNFADRYAAFRVSKNFGEFLANTFSAPGILCILLFAAGALYSLSRPELRSFAVIQIIQLAGVVIQFGKTQDFGPHHHYLLLALMLPLATLVVAELIHRFQWRPVAFLLPAGVLGYVLSFTAVAPGAPYVLKPVLGIVDGAPMVRHDLSEWRRMAKTMDGVLLAEGQGIIYVLASSTTINCSDLLSVNRSLRENYLTPQYVHYSAEIDKRDGFPNELLKARYVLAADPVQLDFAPTEQQIIAVPEHELLQGSGIAGAFKKFPYEFVLDGGVKVFIFEKVRDFTPGEITYLSDELRKAHPDRPYIYLPPQIDKKSM